MLRLPRLYPIVDAGGFETDEQLLAFARELLQGGATILQYRNKTSSPRQMLAHARELRRVTQAAGALLFVNDRPDIAAAADADGVHLGQEDLSASEVRRVFATTVAGNPLLIGVSTHHPEQLRAAADQPADHLAIGPVFATSSKARPDPVVGLEGVRAARALTQRPLVAIGGITVDNAPAVIEAGADAVAVIGALRDEPRNSVAAFLRVLR